MEDFTVWRNGPGIDASPIQSVARGLGAVPVWFVRTSDFLPAISDGVLTIGELAAVPSLLMGTADFYLGVVHPAPDANVPKATFVARGTLADGRRFRVHFNAVTTPNRMDARTKITIG